MKSIPLSLQQSFVSRLKRRSVPSNHFPHYVKWLRFYLDFCQKYNHLPHSSDSRSLFMRKLSEKGQGPFKQKQAAEAVDLYHSIERNEKGVPDESCQEHSTASSSKLWRVALEKMEVCIKTRQYSPKTLATYVMWVRRFQTFLEDKSLESVVAADAARFFSYLAVERKVAASTQNQAFNSLLFFFRHVLKREFEGLDGVVRAKSSKYIPVVLSREEVEAIFSHLSHPYNLVVKLLYGCGLRLFEGVNLRVNCLNFDAGMLTIHDGKGKKDRTVPMPESLLPDLKRQVQRVKWQLGRDNADGFAGVFLPSAMERKFRNAARELPWQWLFPARSLTLVPATEELRRYHMHETKLSEVIRTAARKAAIMKRVTAHTFRHTFASHLLQHHYDIRTIPQLLGHSDVRTTMIYTHTVPSDTLKKPRSPLDL